MHICCSHNLLQQVFSPRLLVIICRLNDDIPFRVIVDYQGQLHLFAVSNFNELKAKPLVND